MTRLLKSLLSLILTALLLLSGPAILSSEEKYKPNINEGFVDGGSAGHFALTGILGAPSMDLSNAHAYPVPFKPSLGHTHITFTNLSSIATIRVYTINGELVRELTETDGDGMLRWDVTNEDSEPLGSDVFIYMIENDQEKKIGKIMVVR